MASPSRKRKAITLETKYEIIHSVQNWDSQKKDIANKFGIPPNTFKYNFKKQGVYSGKRVQYLFIIPGLFSLCSTNFAISI